MRQTLQPVTRRARQRLYAVAAVLSLALWLFLMVAETWTPLHAWMHGGAIPENDECAVAVFAFMLWYYRMSGAIACITLLLNVFLLYAAMLFMKATITLPGLGGMVLTMGMAVDANVLIYERIREEQRNGRSMLASIDQGFRRARATIMDANATHLIASLILFQLGSGPVRGFAVTLGVGIVTSFFTAVMVTRLIVVLWLNIRRPRKLAI